MNYKHYYPVAGLYFGMLFYFLTKTCTTNDVCSLLCFNMAVTYLFKEINQ